MAQTCLVVTLRRFLSTIPFTEQDRHYLFMRSAPRPPFRPWHQAGHLAHLQTMIAYRPSFFLLHRVHGRGHGWSTLTLCFHSCILMSLTQDDKKPRLSERPTRSPSPGIFFQKKMGGSISHEKGKHFSTHQDLRSVPPFKLMRSRIGLHLKVSSSL